MRTFALATGSSGNCFYIESNNKIKILVDVGLSFSRVSELLKERGINVLEIDAILITHEHADHVIGLDSIMKKIKCPIYMSKGTFSELKLKESERIFFVQNHDKFSIKEVNVFVIDKPHDAKEAISYVIEGDNKKVGVFTDIGHITDEIKHIIKTLDIVYFEANYCEKIIKENERDLSLPYLNRLMSDIGHLGVNQSCEALADASHSDQKIIISHISENTNSYENTYRSILTALNSVNKIPEVIVGFQGEPTEWIE